jgi:hypothetical protein
LAEATFAVEALLEERRDWLPPGTAKWWRPLPPPVAPVQLAVRWKKEFFEVKEKMFNL